ncbi:MAG: site-specific integrase [Gammaproteobacteria bacterium]
MARSTRNSALESRTNRARLAPGKRHWQTVGKGLAIGYRRGVNGGTWYVRRALPGNQYAIMSIGIADDHREADGEEVLDYFQTQDKARKLVAQKVIRRSRYTVEDCLQDYLAWAETNTKGYAATKRAVDAHILPKLGPGRCDDLSAVEIRRWHEGLAKADPRVRTKPGKAAKHRPIDRKDPEALRSRKATANRVLTVLKAALNRAYQDEAIASADAWRKVKPFAKADAAKIRYLSADESRRLMNAASPEFRSLVRAALLTGARWGELTALRAGDFTIQPGDPTKQTDKRSDDNGSIHVRESKSGKPRFIPLTAEGVAFFKAHTAGLASSTFMFTKADGKPWGKSHQHRPMKEACANAKIVPACSFHDLRNTYGALLAMAGTPVQVIGNLLGHADTRITEKHYAHLSPSHVADMLRANLPTFEPVKPSNVNRIAG